MYAHSESFHRRDGKAVFWRHSESTQDVQHTAAATNHEEQALQPGGIRETPILTPQPVMAHRSSSLRHNNSYPSLSQSASPDNRMDVYESSGMPAISQQQDNYYATFQHNAQTGYNMTPAALHAQLSSSRTNPEFQATNTDNYSYNDRYPQPYYYPSSHSFPTAPQRIPHTNSSGGTSELLRYPLEEPPRPKAPPPVASTWTPPTGIVGFRGQEAVDRSSVAQDAIRTKKKAKMHRCTVCSHEFPRPSGLQTHMNSHNNVRPYGCSFPGCKKTFGVRSNAKRHLRTHGPVPQGDLIAVIKAESPPSPSRTRHSDVYNHSSTAYQLDQTYYSYGESALPVVSSATRWLPASLMGCTNASQLREATDREYYSSSDYDFEHEDGSDGSDVSSVSGSLLPLQPVVPDERPESYEERNSYLPMPAYPYHPSQFRVLPGPRVPEESSFQ